MPFLLLPRTSAVDTRSLPLLSLIFDMIICPAFEYVVGGFSTDGTESVFLPLIIHDVSIYHFSCFIDVYFASGYISASWQVLVDHSFVCPN